MDFRKKLVEQKIKGDGESICYKCFHNKVCKAMDNQPCIECNQFVDAHGITVQKCKPKCWDVCNNNGNIQYRCPHCETVYVYMYKNHIAPDVCKECGARLYLPQPPKGE